MSPLSLALKRPSVRSLFVESASPGATDTSAERLYVPLPINSAFQSNSTTTLEPADKVTVFIPMIMVPALAVTVVVSRTFPRFATVTLTLMGCDATPE